MNALTHISTRVSFANLVLAAQGDAQTLTAQPRLRTGVRLYGTREIIEAAKELVSQVQMTLEDKEEVLEKVNNNIITMKLTERTEEQKENKEKYRLIRCATHWSAIIDFLMAHQDDAVMMNGLRSIRNAVKKKFTATVLNDVVLLLRKVMTDNVAEGMFVQAAKHCLSIVGVVKGGIVNADGVTSIYPVAGGVMANIYQRTPIFISSEWFTEEMFAKVRRISFLDTTCGNIIKPDYVSKVGILISNGICLDGMSREDIHMQLAYDHDMWMPKVKPLKVPSAQMAENVQIKTGFIEPGKAADGMFTFYPHAPVQYTGLAEQVDGVFRSIVDGKKFAARQEKLNKDREDAFKIQLNNVVFIKDVPENMKDMFNTGCFYMAAKDLVTYGVCRIVSNIDNGMLKGATHLATTIDPKLGVTHSFICASSFKGGLVGTLRASGHTDIDLSQDIVVPEGFWDVVVINDEEVEAKICSIEVMVTNPYTAYEYTQRKDEVELDIDAVDLNTVEKLYEEYDDQKDNSIAFEMFEEVVQRGTTITKVIQDYEQHYNLKRKRPLTTIVSSDIESVRNAYGKEVAAKLVKSLVSSPLNTANRKRKYAFDILEGNYNVVNTLTMQELLAIFLELKEEYSISNSTFTSCNRNFLIRFVESIGANTKERGWIKVGNNVHIPTGNALYGDLEKTSDTLDKVVVTGILSKVLKHIDDALKINTVSSEVLERLEFSLNIEVQWAFLNKEFGRLKTVGRYFVALPGHWLEEKYDVCLPGRDLYVPKKSKKKFVYANIGKQPIIFHGSFAGCRVFKDIPFFDSLHPELRNILSCVAFVHPDYLLELQNDADGDLVRVSFDGYILPLYDSGVLEQEGSAFFKAYIVDENDFAVGDVQKVKTFTPSELQSAIKDAVLSKERVGLYTDAMHIISTHIDDICGLDEEKRRMIVRFYGVLIQECAMNAIKHNSNGEGLTVADTLTLKRLCDEDSKGKNIGINRARKAVYSFLDAEGFDFTSLGMDLKEATKLIVKTAYDITSEYSTRNEELVRRVFKNMPSMNGEFVEFKGLNLKSNGSSSFGVLLEALRQTV